MTTARTLPCPLCNRKFATDYALQQHQWASHQAPGCEPKKKRERGPVLCDYCGKHAELVTGKAIYPHRPDLHNQWFWRCLPCDAHVGTHEGSHNHVPLGRLAKADLRASKSLAHAHFDPLWRAKMRRDQVSKGKARGAAYQWLATQLGIHVHDCHIGMFDVAQCMRVVELCRPYVSRRTQ